MLGVGVPAGAAWDVSTRSTQVLQNTAAACTALCQLSCAFRMTSCPLCLVRISVWWGKEYAVHDLASAARSSHTPRGHCPQSKCLYSTRRSRGDSWQAPLLTSHFREVDSSGVGGGTVWTANLSSVAAVTADRAETSPSAASALCRAPASDWQSRMRCCSSGTAV